MADDVGLVVKDLASAVDFLADAVQQIALDQFAYQLALFVQDCPSLVDLEALECGEGRQINGRVSYRPVKLDRGLLAMGRGGVV